MGAEALPYYDKQPKFGTYSCSGMVTAADKYGIKFDDSDASKVEAAAFIANVGHETRGLQYLEEIQKQPYCSPCTTGAVCQCDSCKCASGQEYFGRGPLQLSYNFNYHYFQIDSRNPVSVDLVAQPSELLANPARGWESAMWFWSSKRAGYTTDPTIHEILAGDARNFGKTIERINKIECGAAWNKGHTKGEGMDRVQRFRDLLAKLNVPIPDEVASWSAENPACGDTRQCRCPYPNQNWACDPSDTTPDKCGYGVSDQCVCHSSASLRGSGNHSVVGNMTSMQGQDLVCPTWLIPHFAEALPYYDKQPKFGTYSCSGMVTAAGKYGIKFDDSDASKVEAAAFIANVGHETNGLHDLEEIDKSDYCDACKSSCPCQCDSCKCAAGQEYFGRGPLQLSWNYNYHYFQIDKRNPVSADLVAQPSEVLANPARGWESAMWFWNAPRAGFAASDKTISQILAGDASNFGETIKRINGMECKTWQDGKGWDRVQRFKDLLEKLDVPIPQDVASWSAEKPACDDRQCVCPSPNQGWACDPHSTNRFQCGAAFPDAQCDCH